MKIKPVWICWEEKSKKKKNEDKCENATWRNKSKDIHERKEIQKVRRPYQAKQTKEDIPKDRKIILLISNEECMSTNKHRNLTEENNFGEKQKEHYRKAE